VANTTNNSSEADLAVNLVLHASTHAGEDIFNNYGPKPNSEFILGYGFALSPNPYDTIVLQIGVGGPNAKQRERKKFEIGKNAKGAELLWAEVLLLDSSNSETTEKTYEDYLRGAEKLGDIVFRLLDNLPKVGNAELHNGIRSTIEPRGMLKYYVDGSYLSAFRTRVQADWPCSAILLGQRDILQSLLEFASDKERSAAETALAQGIELVFEDGELIEGEESDSGQYDDAWA
jgi:hypothetical protein